MNIAGNRMARPVGAVAMAREQMETAGRKRRLRRSARAPESRVVCGGASPSPTAAARSIRRSRKALRAMKPPVRLLAAALLVAATALPAAAQGRNVPGATGTDPMGDLGSYKTTVRNEVDAMLAQWRQAWDSDDVKGLAGMYTRDAVLLTSVGEPVRSRDAIRDRLADVLPKVGTVQTLRVDFGTSGEIAYVSGQVLYEVRADPGAAPAMRTGTFVVVAERQWDDTWQIQSQTIATGSTDIL